MGTKIDISGVAIPAEVNDEMFKKPKVAKKKNDETFFEKEKTSEGVSDARKALQKKVDDKVVAEAGKTPLLKEYLSSKFSLKKGDKPHLMTFKIILVSMRIVEIVKLIAGSNYRLFGN